MVLSKIFLCLKGIAMGAANVIPGVSGGTIALVTGIYERLIGAIGSIDSEAVALLLKGKFKEFWAKIDGAFLLWLLLGVGIATFSLAKLMVFLLDVYPIQTNAFFFGLIIASAILLLAAMKEVSGWDFLLAALGIAAGVAVSFLPNGSGSDSLLYIFLCGVVSICAMILPGISGSFILLVMGKYEYIMESIDGVLHLNLYSILVVAVFALGCVIGLLAFAKLLKWLLSRWNRQTIMVLCGFVLGSLVKVWPWFGRADIIERDSSLHLPGAILWCIVGIALFLGLERLGKTLKKQND